MRRAHRLPASAAALALVVPTALLGLTPPGASGHGTPAGAQTSSEPVSWPRTTMSLSSAVTVAGLPVSALVTVGVPGGSPAGPVEVLVDGTAAASAPLSADGSVRVSLPATVAVGRHSVVAVYPGAPGADPPVASTARSLTVLRTVPGVRTDGTDWSVGRADPKVIRVQVTGVAGLPPTGTVVAWVNGVRRAAARLDPSGGADLSLATSTKSSLVVLTYGGDDTYLPWAAPPRLLVVR